VYEALLALPCTTPGILGDVGIKGDRFDIVMTNLTSARACVDGEIAYSGGPRDARKAIWETFDGIPV
jgi:hypothetical protein